MQLTGVPYADVATWFGFDSNALPRRWWTVGHVHVRARGRAASRREHVCAVRVRSAASSTRGATRSSPGSICSARLGGVAFEMLFIRGSGLVGASAPVFGVMTAYAMQWPDDELYLMFIVPMRARTLAAGMFGFNLVLGLDRDDRRSERRVLRAPRRRDRRVHLHAHGGDDEHGSGAAARRESAGRR